MSEGMKPGWRRVRFGEVVHLNKDTSKNPEADGLERYVGLEHLEPGDLRIRSWGDIADGTTFTNRFRPGHVLFGKCRAYQRKVAVADFDGICSGDIYVLESKDPSVLLPELLPFICQTDTFFEHAINTSAGSLSPRTNWKSLANYEFALPSLEEQRRMVSLLAKARKALDEFESARTQAQTLYDATLCRLYTSGLDGRSEIRKNQVIPKGWKLLPLTDRYEVQLGKMMSRIAREGEEQTPMPIRLSPKPSFWRMARTRHVFETAVRGGNLHRCKALRGGVNTSPCLARVTLPKIDHLGS